MSNLCVRMNGIMPSVNLPNTQKNNSLAFKGRTPNFAKSALRKSQNYLKNNRLHLWTQCGAFAYMFFHNPSSLANLDAFVLAKIAIDFAEMLVCSMVKKIFGNVLPTFGIKHNSINMFAHLCSDVKKNSKSFAKIFE